MKTSVLGLIEKLCEMFHKETRNYGTSALAILAANLAYQPALRRILP